MVSPADGTMGRGAAGGTAAEGAYRVRDDPLKGDKLSNSGGSGALAPGEVPTDDTDMRLRYELDAVRTALLAGDGDRGATAQVVGDWAVAAATWEAELRSALLRTADHRAAAAFAADVDVAVTAAAACRVAAAAEAADAAAARRLHERLNPDTAVPQAASTGVSIAKPSTAGTTSRGGGSTPPGSSKQHAAMAAAGATSSPLITSVDKGKQPAGMPPRRPAATTTAAPVACAVCLTQTTAGSSARHACGHAYCLTPCLARSFTTATRQTDLLPLRCCGQSIDIRLVKTVGLSTAAIKAFRAAHEEATAANKMYCPVPTCSTFLNVGHLLSTLPPEADARDFPCRGCKTRLCLRCKHEAHGDTTCAATAAARAATSDDALVRSLAAAAGWRACTGCGALVELLFGCNHITCRCGVAFCYACGVPWKGCACPQWEEQRLTIAAAEEVERQERVHGAAQGGRWGGTAAPRVEGGAVAAAAAREARIAAAATRMRRVGHDECGHAWVRRGASGLTTRRCERCSYALPVYGYECQSRCALTVCYTCRFHRLR